MVNLKDVRLLDGPNTETVMNISSRGKHFIGDDSNTKYRLLDNGWLAEEEFLIEWWSEANYNGNGKVSQVHWL